MKTGDRLSVIIISFNTKHVIESCLSSLLNYRGSLRLEILVGDNGSCDDSVSFIRSRFPQVSVYPNRENLGFAKANNRLIRRSTAEWVLLLNPDTKILTPIDVLTEYMRSHPSVGALTGRLEDARHTLDDACHRGFPTPFRALSHFSGISRLFPFSSGLNGYHLGYRDLDRIHEVDSVSGAFLLVRRRAGDQIGWLDEDYFWYGEDLDFCYRIKQAGWKVVYHPGATILHYRGVASGIKRQSRYQSKASSDTALRAMKARFDVMEIFYRKHYQNRYPFWVTWLVITSIRLFRFLRIEYRKVL